MFTGIVEETGSIKGIRKGEKSVSLTVGCSHILKDTQTGDSISVNGVCLTVTSMAKNCFESDVMPETIRATNLKYLKPRDAVNLERAVSPAGRFGGHIVTGHIDGTGTILETAKEGNAVWLTIEASNEILKYVIHKGSIAVDGVSLTVQYVDDKIFKIAVIPHTRDYTMLHGRKPGYSVNIECDIIGKYIERLMKMQQKEEKTGISLEYLLENGY